MKLTEKKIYEIQLTDEEIKKWTEFYFLVTELFDTAEPISNFVYEHFENILKTMDYLNKEYLNVEAGVMKID